jgi:hypothetical protein
MAAACLFLISTGAVFLLRLFPPEPRVAPLVPFESYDRSFIQSAVSAEAVRAEQDRILAFGSRFMGQPGFYATEEYIRKAFQDVGLEVREQENWTAVPVTDRREIALADGSPMPGIEVYPFMPNHLQPMVTPDEGLTGELVLLTTETLASRSSFEGCIGLLDAREGRVPVSLSFKWFEYARLGLSAIVIASPEGLDGMPWDRIGDRFNGMVGSDPVNYVRLVADGDIFRYTGQKVRLRVKTRWAEVRNTTIFGLLRAGEKASKALILPAHYDACSLLPDRAPGTEQALDIATQLALVRGLAAYKSSIRRDVIFVAQGGEFMSSDGVNSILSVLDYNIAKAKSNPLLVALGINSGAASAQDEAGLEAKREHRLAPLRARNDANEARLAKVQAVEKALEMRGFLKDTSATAQTVNGLEPSARDFLSEQLRYVLNTLVFDYSEPVLQAKVGLSRIEMETGKPVFDENAPAMQALMSANKNYEEALSAAGFSIVNLVERKPAFIAKRDAVKRGDVASLLRERFDELLAYHLKRQKRLAQDRGVVDLFNPYSEIVVTETRLAPAAEPAAAAQSVSFSPCGQDTGPQAPTFQSLLNSSAKRLELQKTVEIPTLDPKQTSAADEKTGGMPGFGGGMWSEFGYPTFRIVNIGRQKSYGRYCYPVELPFMRDTATMDHSLQLAGETVLSLAHGIASFLPSGTQYWRPRHEGGRVLVSNVGQSVVPNYPLKNALLTARSVRNFNMFSLPGVYGHLLKFTDPYGEFDLPSQASDFVCWWQYWSSGGYSPLAASYGPDGLIRCMKDEGEDGQRLYKSVKVEQDAGKWANLTIVTFRAMPVTVMDLLNPQTMSSYTAVELLSQSGHMAFKKQCIFEDGNMYTTFIEPHERFFAALKSGTAANPLAQETHAFVLGANSAYALDPSKDIDGPGFLVADTPVLRRVPFEVSHSLLQVNGKRLDLENYYGMADERTKEYHEKSQELEKKSLQPGQSLQDARLVAQDSVTYSELNHPVIRRTINEAVLGIIWYLGLLIPFVFFFEKLVFGFSDIRKQIATDAIIFITFFVLLRLLHPAFSMVRAPLMILLGFVIIIISGGITVLFGVKFQENLEELRKKRGKVTAAEVNVMGAIGSAFMLGLNNMHRRKVRTGLTCVTLVLMTFVMICFSSVQSNIVDETVALGKAPYDGLLVKQDNMRALTSLPALRLQFGDRFHVNPRRMVFGTQDWQERRCRDPKIEIVYGEGNAARKVPATSIVQLSANEPLRNQIRLLTPGKWFTPDQEVDGTPLPALIPDTMARQLGITAEQLMEGPTTATVNGLSVCVQGIFDSASFASVRDTDGTNLLPYDLEAMSNPIIDSVTRDVLISDRDPRVQPGKLILLPSRESIPMAIKYAQTAPGGALFICVSVAVDLTGTRYKEEREVIDKFLEQKAERIFYGIGGAAFSGKRSRENSLAGLVELIIPLIIAALTVLNTMKGSVYERRDEIFVYNAVGIAPRYVFFMFFAEAFVYAVVGSVLGYILSQGVGKALTALHMTGGLNMSFTSYTTVLASIAIGFAVFCSTYFPAKSAMEIAAPAEESGWSLPEPQGDDLRFRLPFTFGKRDRVAILAFFDRFLRDHGEGSAGRFFASEPRMEVSDRLDPLANDAYIPQIDARTWLKPFDLAVSQQMTIALPTDEETGEYIAEISLRRLSGTREAWLRLNHSFVQMVRRHFLYWRAVAEPERAVMFEEAKAGLERELAGEVTTHG